MLRIQCTFLLCFYNSTGLSSRAQHHAAQEEAPECCQVDFLYDFAAEMPSSWQTFGLCLGIEYGRLEAVEEKNRGVPLKCFAEVYSIWGKETCKPVTWSTAVEILEGNLLKDKALAIKLRKKYGVL